MIRPNRFVAAAAGAALVTLAGLASAIDKPRARPVGGTIKWIYDYEEGKRLSRATGKPMFVVFRCER